MSAAPIPARLLDSIDHAILIAASDASLFKFRRGYAADFRGPYFARGRINRLLTLKLLWAGNPYDDWVRATKAGREAVEVAPEIEILEELAS